mgnify:CR=1 FL=1
MTTQHTPGPWHIGPMQKDGASYIQTQHGDALGYVFLGPYPEAGPNARLIAAAPELLQALRALTEIGQTPDGGIILGPQGWDIARAAIAKATGQ